MSLIEYPQRLLCPTCGHVVHLALPLEMPPVDISVKCLFMTCPERGVAKTYTLPVLTTT